MMKTAGCARYSSLVYFVPVSSFAFICPICLHLLVYLSNHPYIPIHSFIHASIYNPMLCLALGFRSIQHLFPWSFPRPELVLGLGSILCHGKPSPFLPLSPWRRSNTSIMHLNPLARSNSSTGMILIWQRLQLIPLSHVQCWRSMIPAVLKLHYLLRHAKLCCP